MKPPADVDYYAGLLAAYVQTSVGEYEKQCAAEAAALVEAYTSGVEGIPTDPYNRAVLEAAAELWNRRGAPNGIKSFGDLESPATFRIARDPMVAARPILAPYLPLVIS